jgi:hypothetical protein
MASRLTALALDCTRTQLTIDRVLDAQRGHDRTVAVATTTQAAHPGRQLVADPYPAVAA